MPRLVALAMPGGDLLVDNLRRVWDRGDAALVVDIRLSPATRHDLIDELAASTVVDEYGSETPLGGGRSVEEGDALVVATSGTTGKPKGAVLTHRAIAQHARSSTARLMVDPDRDRWLACLPLAHVGGLSVVTRALVTGTPLTVLPGFDRDAVEVAARNGANLVSLVPTTLARVEPALFRTILLGGSAPPELPPPNAVTTYGMTESGGGVVYDGIPFDGVEIKITGTREGSSGEEGSGGGKGAGEILLRSPTLARCYRTAREDLPVAGSGGWYATGDIGSLDRIGWLTVHGRADEMIVTGGENVWPAPIEALLAAHPGIADAAVAGHPDPEWGQKVVAYLVPADPAAPPTIDSIRSWVKERLSPWAAPREIVLARKIPRTESGKIRRKSLSYPTPP